MDKLPTATLLLGMVLTGCTTTRATSPTPEPAALPAATITPEQRVVAYPHGSWLLYGDGTAASPYAWVWVPTGATPPLPRPPGR